jgi:hypothetical protein
MNALGQFDFCRFSPTVRRSLVGRPVIVDGRILKGESLIPMTTARSSWDRHQDASIKAADLIERS